MDLVEFRNPNAPLIPAVKQVNFRIFSSVTSYAQICPNTVKIVGNSFGSGLVTLVCDSRKASFHMEEHCSAVNVAVQIAAHLPDGFRALVDGTTVCVWSDDDFFAMIA
jgi:hypothetical protein